MPAKKTRQAINPFDVSLTMVNQLFRERKKIHVIIAPNPDYALADLFVGIASLVSGGIGIVNSASGLMALVRTISFIKTSREVIDKIKDGIEQSSITLRPGEQAEVFSAYKHDPIFWTKLSGLISIFGGKAWTIMVFDEDLERSVMFNTALGEHYYTDERGVGNPMHQWNQPRAFPADVSSSAAPTLVWGKNEMLMLYRHDAGNRIFIATFKNGRFVPKDQGWVNWDTAQGVGGVMMNDALLLCGRHSEGEQLFSIWRPEHGPGYPYIPFEMYPPVKWMGPDIQGRPSAVNHKDNTFIVAKHRFPGNAIMYAVFNADGSVRHGNTGIDTGLVPSMVLFTYGLTMVYSDPGSKQLKLAVSKNGSTWHRHCSLPYYSSAGAALTVYKNRLYVFFRDPNGNGVFYAWSDDGTNFKDAGRARYFGLDIDAEPTAAPMPGDNAGIMVAGLEPGSTRSGKGQVMWTVFTPWEPGDKPRAAKKAAPKKKTSKAVVQKTARKKTAVKKAAKSTPASGTKKAAKKTAPKKQVQKLLKKSVKPLSKAAARKAAPKVAKKQAGKAPQKAIAGKPQSNKVARKMKKIPLQAKAPKGGKKK